MESTRREQRKAKTKSQILTKGGIYDYGIELSEISILATLISPVSTDQLPFLLDALFTQKELVDITRRLIIGQLIIQNKTYEEITQTVHVSHNTIALVSQSLWKHNGILRKTLTDNFRLSARDNRKQKIRRDISPAEQYFINRIKKGK